MTNLQNKKFNGIVHKQGNNILINRQSITTTTTTTTTTTCVLPS
jgi:hypothetical protein